MTSLRCVSSTETGSTGLKPSRLASLTKASGIAMARMPKAGSRTSSPGRLGRGPSPMMMRWSLTRNSWVATAVPWILIW